MQTRAPAALVRALTLVVVGLLLAACGGDTSGWTPIALSDGQSVAFRRTISLVPDVDTLTELRVEQDLALSSRSGAIDVTIGRCAAWVGGGDGEPDLAAETDGAAVVAATMASEDAGLSQIFASTFVGTAGTTVSATLGQSGIPEWPVDFPPLEADAADELTAAIVERLLASAHTLYVAVPSDPTPGHRYHNRNASDQHVATIGFEVNDITDEQVTLNLVDSAISVDVGSRANGPVRGTLAVSRTDGLLITADLEALLQLDEGEDTPTQPATLRIVIDRRR